MVLLTAKPNLKHLPNDSKLAVQLFDKGCGSKDLPNAIRMTIDLNLSKHVKYAEFLQDRTFVWLLTGQKNRQEIVNQPIQVHPCTKAEQVKHGHSFALKIDKIL